MITNAVLISCEPPATPDRFGNETPGQATAYPAGTRVCVCEPSRQHLAAVNNVVDDASDVMFLPLRVSPVPVDGSVVTYRLVKIGATERRAVSKAITHVHGSQSHYELVLKVAK